MSIISGANAVVGSAVGGYQIERSLRSNGTYAGGSDYMQRQNSGTSGNRKVWTLSLWMKICNITSNDEHIWMVSNTGVGGNPSSYVRLLLENNVLKLGSNGSASEAFASTALLRDVSAWYHVVISCDNANTILRVYVNGVEWTTTNGFLASKTNPTNTDGVVNNASYYNHFCMFRTAEPRTFNGYLAEIHFVDGSALPATTFGEFNSETGVWQPIKVTGVTYGTQGYYLPLNDNASTTTLGYDAAGSNDFTLTGFSVTAGAGNDSLVDTPTPYGTDTGAGGEVRGNYCVMSPILAGGTTNVNGNLDVTCPDNKSTGGTFGMSSGKWYFEATVASANYVSVGVARNDEVWGTNLNGSSEAFMYSYVGTVYTKGSADTTPDSFTTNDIISVCVDLNANKLYFLKNGSGITISSGTQNPSTGTNGISLDSGYTYFSAITANGNNAVAYFNFGQRPFAYTAPSGFKALCTQNLPEPTILDGEDYFNAVLWTGNGATQSITGVGFQPDLVWTKDRNAAYDHTLFDAVRGATKFLRSNATSAEETRTDSLTSFNSDGFSVGADSVRTNINKSGAPYVSWNWKANGAGVLNEVGTIDSTVSANTTSGFSIVTWSGTGTNGTVGHGLGAAPSLVIVKQRTGTANWNVWFEGYGADGYLLLNTTAAKGTYSGNWGVGTFDSTVFSVSSGAWNNGSGSTYVGYVFSEIPGFSSFGTYTGNGSADGPFVYCGFRPRWVMVHCSSAAISDWPIYDSSRPTYNQSRNPLYADLANAESTAGLAFDILSNGFKWREAGGQGNDSGQTYIYAAFAENPFKYALAR